MANTTNLDLVPLDGSDKLKNFSTPYNGNLTKIDNFAEDMLNGREYSSSEKKVGKWNGSTLYRRIFSEKKTNSNWGSLISTGISQSKIKKYEAYCINSDENVLATPYYSSSDDLFKAIVQLGQCWVQLGNTYPTHGGNGATIIFVIYYTK